MIGEMPRRMTQGRRTRAVSDVIRPRSGDDEGLPLLSWSRQTAGREQLTETDVVRRGVQDCKRLLTCRGCHVVPRDRCDELMAGAVPRENRLWKAKDHDESKSNSGEFHRTSCF